MTIRKLLPAVLVLASGVPAAHAVPKAKPAVAPPAADIGEPLDISTVKDKMSLVTDGKGHYMAYAPLAQMSEFLFYGDGKTFWQQRVFGGGSEGDIQFSKNFWEPRVTRQNGATFEFRNKKFSVDCNDRISALTPVAAAEAKTLVEGAKFNKPRWKWRAHFLARDEHANYYYVDQQRVPEGSKNYRLFVGPKGNLKLQKMTNVVSDTEGEIFATKTGSLRLIAGKSDWQWIVGKVPVKLTHVPVEANAAMIYTDLGVYVGEALGTPCDDL